MAWLEATAIAEWVRTSFIGYPLVLTLHSVGMAIMVGLIFVVNLRLLEMFRRIPLQSLEIMLSIAWIGFFVNLVSGLIVFTSQASFYVTSSPFILKIIMVVIGALTARYMMPILGSDSTGWSDGTVVVNKIRMLALGSLIVWSVAITTGRFTAYL
ncbi:MAG: hypothetical protein ACJ0SL_05610 [Candidatus Rariloculaceae bacterium]